MSDEHDNKDNNVVSLVDRMKKEKEDPSPPIIPEEVLSLMNELLQPDDLSGFLRVLEVLRTIGDEVEIFTDVLDLRIKVTQNPSEEITLEDGTIRKKTEASQTIDMDFAYLPIMNADTDNVIEVDFNDYVNTVTPTLRKGIESLMYWHDGKGLVDEDEDDPKE